MMIVTNNLHYRCLVLYNKFLPWTSL